MKNKHDTICFPMNVNVFSSAYLDKYLSSYRKNFEVLKLSWRQAFDKRKTSLISCFLLLDFLHYFHALQSGISLNKSDNFLGQDSVMNLPSKHLQKTEKNWDDFSRSNGKKIKWVWKLCWFAQCRANINLNDLFFA